MTRPSASAKVKRDRAIAFDRARGLRWQTIAARHGLTARQCQNIFREQRIESIAQEDPPAGIDEFLEQLDALYEEAALIGGETKNDACRLGSINSRLRIMEFKMGVMQAVRVLPQWEEFQFDERTRAAMSAVSDFLTERLGGDGDWIDDFLERVQRIRADRNSLVMDTPVSAGKGANPARNGRRA